MSKNEYQSIPAFISKAKPVIPMAETVSTSPVMMVREGGAAANHLNDEQLAAVSNLTGLTVVNAGAGTGKSTLLVERMRRIKTLHPNTNVLMISFTKKAAQELKDRISSIGITGCQISTLHSLAYHSLMKDKTGSFTVLTSDNYRRSLISKLITAKMDISTEDVIFALHSPSRARKDANTVMRKYLKQLQKNRQIDLDSMQLLALEKLDDKAVCRYWQSKYDFILVDEAQDLDEVQLAIINKLSSNHKNLCCVGDTRQSIYGFRGSMPDVLNKLEKDNEAMNYDMTINYRCSPAILGLANRIMSEYKPLIANNRYGYNVLPQYLVADNEQDEAAILVKEVQKRHKAGITYKDMAIIYRSSIVSRSVVHLLLDKKIPFVCSNLTGFLYNQQPLRGMVTLLRYLNNPNDKQIWPEILPMLFLKRTAQKDIEKVMQAKDLSFIEAINELELPFFHKDYIERFTTGILKASNQKPNDAIKTLITAGYNKLIGKPAIPTVEAMADEAEGYDTIYAYLAHIDQRYEEYQQMKKAASNAAGDCIRLMTIHAAKGLEFNTVFIIGAYDGIIPAGNDGTDIAEEKRLLYVAVTRAKERLYISYPKYTEKSISPNEASRFLREVF
ncbi:ATP-dependent helicase [Anaerovibrio sp.]|uniref:ATP-dependent helicase n=1 Tax=Anaerovibrio sp. TaxID=1872532 RepID=UPI0025C27281|nr:ATP-dependent helicase [Anaerovibrio sp.]MBR2142755.1 ATP-dependent helicase [Anaerovibrio sp.]